MAKLIEQAIERAQRKWTDDQKRYLYRDFKTYVPPDHNEDRERDFDDDLDDEIELVEEEELPPDEDDSGDIDPGWIDFVTRDQLLDAVLSQAAEEALVLKKRRKKAAGKKKRKQLRPASATGRN